MEENLRGGGKIPQLRQGAREGDILWRLHGIEKKQSPKKHWERGGTENIVWNEGSVQNLQGPLTDDNEESKKGRQRPVNLQKAKTGEETFCLRGKGKRGGWVTGEGGKDREKCLKDGIKVLKVKSRTNRNTVKDTSAYLLQATRKRGHQKN